MVVAANIRVAKKQNMCLIQGRFFAPTPFARPSLKTGMAGQAEEVQKRQAKEAEVVGF